MKALTPPKLRPNRDSKKPRLPNTLYITPLKCATCISGSIVQYNSEHLCHLCNKDRLDQIHGITEDQQKEPDNIVSLSDKRCPICKQTTYHFNNEYICILCNEEGYNRMRVHI